MAIVCQTCGDQGFVEALVFCDSCKIASVHRYCLGITPVPIEDYITWFCVICDGSESGSDCEEVDVLTVKLKHLLKKKKKKRNNHTPLVSVVEDNVLQDAIACDGSEGDPDCEEVDVLTVKLKHLLMKKKKKSNNHTPLISVVEDNVLQDAIACDGSEGDPDCKEVDVLTVKLKHLLKKKKKKSNNHTPLVSVVEDNVLQDAIAFDGSEGGRDCQEDDVLAVKRKHLLKKKKKKKKKSNNYTSLVSVVEDNVLQDTNVEPVMVSSPLTKETKKEFEGREISASRKPHESNGLVRKGASALEATSKESEKREISGCGKPHESSGLERKAVSVLEATSKESERREISDSRKPHERTGSVGKGASVLGAISKESVRREISGSGKPDELTGLVASVLEFSNSPIVEDQDSSTSKKRKLSSGHCHDEAVTFKPRTPLGASSDHSNIPHTSENRQKDVGKSSFNTQALDPSRAQPIITPVWRGLISVKEGNIHRIDGLVAHLSSLACKKSTNTASSLHTHLSAEMFPRLEIWPRSFLKTGGPKDESIALFFFPSGESNENKSPLYDEKAFESLILEMKTNDFGMRCMLDNAELLLFTSCMLPMCYWSFRSKEYLWGVFRTKKNYRH